jgi:hypothetical protein
LNTYIIEFTAHCPTNGVRVKYSLRIATAAARVIPVETILAEVEAIEGEQAFHEEIADRLAAKFPGSHLLTAHHHGVDIETTRQGVEAE